MSRHRRRSSRDRARRIEARHRDARDPGIVAVLQRRASRNPVLTTAVLVAVHLLLSLLTFQPQPHTGGDNAAYIALGQSLLDRGEYVSLYDPATPPHTQYPPVFPAVLAVAMAAGVQPWVGLKVLISLFSALAVGFGYLWIRRRRRPMLALGIGLILAASPGVLELGHWVLSDVPFWAFTAVSLWAFERLRPELRGRFAVAVLATVLAYFTRSAGLPLVLAAFGWLALRRRWKQLGVLAAVVLPLAVLWWLRARGQGGVDYVSQFWFVDPYQPELGRIGAAGLLDRVLENGSKYIRIHFPILLAGATGPLPLLAGITGLGLAAFGWAKRVRRPTLAEIFLPLYLGLLWSGPAVWSGERFLLPALPLLLYYAGDGLVRIGRLWKPSATLALGAATAAVLLALGLPATVSSMQLSGRCMLDYRVGNRYPCLPPVWREFFDMGEWARASLPQDAVVLSRKPRLFYAISGLRGRVYPFSDSSRTWCGRRNEVRARCIVIDGLGSLSQMYLLPAVLGRPDAFCVMRAMPGGTAMRLGIRPGAAGLPDRPRDPNAAVAACGPEYWRPDARPRSRHRRIPSRRIRPRRTRPYRRDPAPRDDRARLGHRRGLFLLSIGVGLYLARRGSRSLADFFVGGRTVPWWLAGTSMAATTFSIDNAALRDPCGGHSRHCRQLGVVGGGGRARSHDLRVRPALAPREILTDNELTEIRYGGNPAAVLRGVKGFLFAVVIGSIGIGYAMLAMVKVVNALQIFPSLGLNVGESGKLWAILAVSALVLLYAGVAGLWGVIATDFFQFFLGMIGALVVAGWSRSRWGPRRHGGPRTGAHGLRRPLPSRR